MSRGDTLIVLGKRGGGLGEWLLLDETLVAARGADADDLPVGSGRAVLALPAEQAALHWLELGPELTGAQATAAARLMAAELCAEPISEMHVAVGPAKDGRRCVALIRARDMAEWIAEAKALGLDPDEVVPDSLLLAPQGGGWARRDVGDVALVRGPQSAFAIEAEIARLLGPDTAALSEEEFREGAAAALAVAPVGLRQGAFAKRRDWRLDLSRVRRVGLLAILLVAATLAIQIASIQRHTAAADRMEEETRQLAAATAGGDLRRRLAELRGGGLGFGPTAGALFESVQATAGVELSAIVFEPTGVLRATVQADSPGALAALRERIGARGFRAEAGAMRPSGGRHAADLLVRPQ